MVEKAGTLADLPGILKYRKAKFYYLACAPYKLKGVGLYKSISKTNKNCKIVISIQEYNLYSLP